MKIIKNILKWLGLSIFGLLLLVTLVGLSYRIFTSSPQPPGKMVEVGKVNMHINSTGPKSDKPTLVIEAGQALPTEHYYWMGEILKDSLRVVRYDRAGIGYSELSGTPRDPETIARELHALLKASGESPPYILAGHSFGGLFIRVFTQLYPDEVKGLVFIDSSHPDQRQRMGYGPRKDVGWMLSTAAFLGDIGVLGLFDRLNGSVLYVEEFPDEVNERFFDYTKNGRYYRGYREEYDWSPSVYPQARATKDFGSLPIRVYTAGIRYDGSPAEPEWVKLQEVLSELSTDGEHTLLPGHHNSIYTNPKNAEVICGGVMELVRELGISKP